MLAVTTPSSYAQTLTEFPDSIQVKLSNQNSREDFQTLVADTKKLIYNSPDIGFALAHLLNKIAVQKAWHEEAFNTYSCLGIYHQNSGQDFDSAHFYYMKGLWLAEQTNDIKLLSNANNNLGVLNRRMGNYDSALFFYTKALQMAEQLHDSVLMGTYYNNLGLVSGNLEKYHQSLEYHFKALTIRELVGDENSIASSLNNIGIIYSDLKDHKQALHYFRKCIPIWERVGSKRQLLIAYLNIGGPYYAMNEYDTCRKYFEKAEVFASELNDKQSLALIYDNLSTLNEKLNKLNISLYNSLKAISIQRAIGDSIILARSCYHTSQLLLKLKRKKEAMPYAIEAYDIATAKGGLNEIKESALMLGVLHEDLGDFKTALTYYKIYQEKSDSLKSEIYNKNVADVREKYESNKKEEQLKLQQVQIERQTLVAQRNSTQRNFLILAVILIAVIVFLINRTYKTRLNAKDAINQKNKEYESLRSNFFANISHEFRTPLTLIKGPLEEMMKNKKIDMVALDRVVRNADRLQRLISQLLDLSKLEAGKMELRKKSVDLYSFIKAICNSFSIQADKNRIHFDVNIPSGKMITNLDIDKTEKVIYNLLSNAFKFTPSEGNVSLCVIPNDNEFQIDVSDSGRGIPENQLDSIFERFNRSWAEGNYQYEGSGIGLALTKELVENMGGSISVKSKMGEGSVFSIHLPREVPVADAVEDTTPSTVLIETTSPILTLHAGNNELSQAIDLPLILVVEDNEDMRQHILSCLGTGYQLLEAENGQQGLELCQEQIPDIIISDLMMPEMDGIEFCKQVRQNKNIAHVSFVMLTARADDASKLESLGLGADDYLVKPFHAEELNLKIKNTIKRIKLLQDKLRLQLFQEPQESEIMSADASFLFRLRGLIEENLATTELSVESLSREIALSRVQLYRKVQALTGISVNELIRNIRLKKAKQLLDNRWGNVSQVAYEVGFNNLSYFAKCYKSAYGKTPSEYLAEKLPENSPS